MRRALAALIFLSSVMPLYFWCVVPWKCNRAEKSLNNAVAATQRGSQEAATFLVNNLEPTLACLKHTPCEVSLSIAAGTIYSMSGRHDDAISTYDEALRFDRRPEVYFNRAGNRLKSGDPEGAYQDYLLAARFNPDLVAKVRNRTIRARVESELQRLYGDSYP